MSEKIPRQMIQMRQEISEKLSKFITDSTNRSSSGSNGRNRVVLSRGDQKNDAMAKGFTQTYDHRFFHINKLAINNKVKCKWKRLGQSSSIKSESSTFKLKNKLLEKLNSIYG